MDVKGFSQVGCRNAVISASGGPCSSQRDSCTERPLEFNWLAPMIRLYGGIVTSSRIIMHRKTDTPHRFAWVDEIIRWLWDLAAVVSLDVVRWQRMQDRLRSRLSSTCGDVAMSEEGLLSVDDHDGYHATIITRDFCPSVCHRWR